MRNSWWKLVVVVSAWGTLFAPGAPGLVERLYSTQAYIVLQRQITGASNLVPFAVLDVAVAIVAALWLVLAWRDLRNAPNWIRGAWRIGVRTAVWSAAIYLVFVACWGLNYRRTPLREKLSYDASAVTSDALLAAGRRVVDRLNTLNPIAHADGWPAADAVDPALAKGFERAISELRFPATIVVARPKRSALDWYFRRGGVDGLTDPFFLETLTASNLLPFERPFVVAHEWSHLAGVADEGEANFVGWLACMRAGAPAQYSGALFLYRELAASLSERDRAELQAALGPGPRGDLRAVRDRVERDVSPRLSAAGWRFYDSYLRANRVDAGVASYGEVVKLVLGVRLDRELDQGLGIRD